MINYKELVMHPTKFNTIIKKENSLIEELLASQTDIKESITQHTEDITTAFSNNEVFKNMLLSSIEAASLQIEINSKDLENLSTILNIISEKGESLEKDIEQYNTLFSKIDKNIILVNEILEKVDNSFEQLTKISSGNILENTTNQNKQELTKTKTKSKSKSSKKSQTEASSQTITEAEDEKIIEDNSDEGPKITIHKKDNEDSPVNLKKVADSKKSDLLCFFPKSNSDILAISTIQNTYKVLFNKENATVFIEQENFNFTLKTIGVQISNESNVLLVSRKSGGFFIVTNMMVDVPSYINVSKINRNKNFIEITITNPEINVAVDENQLTFPQYNADLGNISKSSEIVKQDPDVFNTPIINEPSEYIKETPENSKRNKEILDDFNDDKDFRDNRKIKEDRKFRDDRDYRDERDFRRNHDFEDEINYKNNRHYNDDRNYRDDRDYRDDRASRRDRDFDDDRDYKDNKKSRDNRDFRDDRDDYRDNRKKDGFNLMEDNDTLIISEKDNQVILPYTIDEVEKEYKKNKKKYSSVEDLIKNEYIVSTNNFKNPIRSRFREAYQLIKKREHGHLKEAIDLGFELMFESKLNPAVIAACKSLRELDIYLDCLDDNELDKFSCFNIVYNVPPTKSSGKSKSKGKHDK